MALNSETDKQLRNVGNLCRQTSEVTPELIDCVIVGGWRIKDAWWAIGYAGRTRVLENFRLARPSPAGKKMLCQPFRTSSGRCLIRLILIAQIRSRRATLRRHHSSSVKQIHHVRKGRLTMGSHLLARSQVTLCICLDLVQQYYKDVEVRVRAEYHSFVHAMHTGHDVDHAPDISI